MDSENKFREEFFKKHDYYQIIILLLKKGESVQVLLTGHCMKPLLCENDLITIQPITAEQLCCGNVAIFHFIGRLKAHRFLKFLTIDAQKHIVTKPDRRSGCDSPVSVIDFLGRITQVRKGNRTINYESKKWKFINSFLGKFSPYISIVEHSLVLLIRLPRKFASRVFKLVMGINFREYIKKEK